MRKVNKPGILVLVVVFAAGLFLFWPGESNQDSVDSEIADSTETSGQDPEVKKDSGSIRMFTPNQFKQAYDNLSLPNITPIVRPPEITGNTSVDDYIRTLAEARGYKLRDVSSGLLNQVEGVDAQELLINAWAELQTQAENDGIEIQIYSGYRPVEEQRQLFTQRLYASGATSTSILNGQSDQEIEQTLQVTAPPGYSRHHSGYTIDVEDPNSFVFAESEAFAWISADNYTVAKTYGFIPSYPDGADNQGPNPEPWEYVWVSKDVTFE